MTTNALVAEDGYLYAATMESGYDRRLIGVPPFRPGDLLVYRSDVVRIHDKMFAPVAEYLRDQPHVPVIEYVQQDPDMLLGAATVTIYRPMPALEAAS